ncbi:MAG TPA: hypothetical protein VFJ53_09130, partial [Solirubrobacterales bacterium]|nr:hypothetical protein [Solirubrobacterales bacterium]
MPFAVLAHAGDAEAELLAAELRRRAGGSSVALVWAEELLLGSRFTHRIDGDGATTEVELASGLRLDSAELRGVVCRLQQVPVPQFRQAPEVDRRYAELEAYALAISWLASLTCPVFNPVTSRGLSGPRPAPPELFSLAASCGLRAQRFRFASGPSPLWLEPVAEPRTVLVVAGRALHPVDDAVAAACERLAERLNCPLLGVLLARSAEGDEVFCGVEALPSLGPAG